MLCFEQTAESNLHNELFLHSAELFWRVYRVQNNRLVWAHDANFDLRFADVVYVPENNKMQLRRKVTWLFSHQWNTTCIISCKFQSILLFSATAQLLQRHWGRTTVQSIYVLINGEVKGPPCQQTFELSLFLFLLFTRMQQRTARWKPSKLVSARVFEKTWRQSLRLHSLLYKQFARNNIESGEELMRHKILDDASVFKPTTDPAKPLLVNPHYKQGRI